MINSSQEIKEDDLVRLIDQSMESVNLEGGDEAI
jgi:hypothetical protein|tara:strand:+ start:191 stop:292 length:102 start_codon:yes stop_codon:yes gene_type:complete